MAYLLPMVQNLALSMDKIIKKKSKSLAEDKENEVTLQAIAQCLAHREHLRPLAEFPYWLGRLGTSSRMLRLQREGAGLSTSGWGSVMKRRVKRHMMGP